MLNADTFSVLSVFIELPPCCVTASLSNVLEAAEITEKHTERRKTVTIGLTVYDDDDDGQFVVVMTSNRFTDRSLAGSLKFMETHVRNTWQANDS